ncbi:hypothetical protein DF185_07250 [Marinifilum breve]|uniref:Lipoprotein n=1 Tax=Marinifilum breve TaxID=2184082 RepID=A0A2V4A1A6_9BACT|nr:hypothetical protein [Marinifilum breve]PXY02438.1 hypothetical protein DF185_07250 [Marinifilum breve]
MKKYMNQFLQAMLALFVLACSPQSQIQYVDNLTRHDITYQYQFKQDKNKELVKVKKSDSIFNYHILDTVLEIHQFIRDPQERFKELKAMMEKLKDRKHMPQIEADSAFYFQSCKFDGQTCFSFALENFFKNNNINPHPYFDSETLIGSKTYLIVLDAINLESKAISWKEFKKNKHNMPKEALLALQEQDRINHGMYYKDGLYYSKNGRSRPAIFPDLKSIVKSYMYTDTVWVYTIDNRKLHKHIASIKNKVLTTKSDK